MNIHGFAAANYRNPINRAPIERAALCLQADILTKARMEYLGCNDCERQICSIDREREDGVRALTRGFIGRFGLAVPVMKLSAR